MEITVFYAFKCKNGNQMAHFCIFPAIFDLFPAILITKGEDGIEKRKVVFYRVFLMDSVRVQPKAIC